MSVQLLDPLKDHRWKTFLNQHPHASVFHSPEWLEALSLTYGYQPLALTTSRADGNLTSAMAFCLVRSPLTGCRFVSLPFSDHCEPLVEGKAELDGLLLYLAAECDKGHWKYIEVRPRTAGWSMPVGFSTSQTFHFHNLDLGPSLERLFDCFHRDSVQRQIRKAERESLNLEAGNSDGLLERFYSLVILTRRRHGLPPQPKLWFQNLLKCLSGMLTIRLASKGGRPIAGIMTLRYKDVMVYKYGGSDAKFHNLGGMQSLFWKMIQEAKAEGCRILDLGRTDCDNLGLVTFKNRWGAERTTLSYFRYPESQRASEATGWKAKLLRQIFTNMPDRMLAASGNLLYRHFG